MSLPFPERRRLAAVLCVPLFALAALMAVSAPARADAAVRVAAEHRAVVNLGTVKWFSDAKGYGFIAPADGGQDVFVHYSDIIGVGYRTLTEGQLVEYQLVQGPKGPQAVNVLPLPL
ncbi:cold-shock protein [Kitasatospora purpeofusca]|uniref:cold-shock protein n=1 Tax=Kitasatospora purpeofusca TaxID=67352 RepID=UPI003B01FF59